MGYVGTAPLSGDYRNLDDISGDFDGSDVTFDLEVGSVAVTPPKETTMLISVGGVLQEPITAYTVSGSVITFTAAPATGADFFGILLGDTMDIGTPSDATVTGAKLATTLLTGLSATTTVADADLVLIDDAAGGTLRKMTRANFIESAALDAINIDGGAIDGTVIGANSAAAGTFAAIVGTTGTFSTSIDVTGSAGVILENDETITNSTNGEVAINGTVVVGTGSATGTLKSSGNYDLTLSTGNSTTGTITITDGADGDIAIAPNGSGSAKVGSAVIKTAGTEDMWIPAAAMTPTESGGCADIESVETTADRPDLRVLDFDTSSVEKAQFQVVFPKSWDAGTVTFTAYWTASSTNTGTVCWALAGISMGDNDSIDVAFPTPTNATAKAHSGTVEDLNISATSGAVTITAAADNELVFFELSRQTGSDDYNADARLIGIKLHYTTEASTDA